MKKPVIRRYSQAVVFSLFFLLILYLLAGCRKKTNDEPKGRLPDSGGDSPGTPNLVHVANTEGLDRSISFAICSDTHENESWSEDFGVFLPVLTDYGNRNREEAKDLNTDCNEHSCLGIIHIGDMIHEKYVHCLVPYRQIWENDYPGQDGGTLCGYSMGSGNNATMYSSGSRIAYPVLPTIGNHDIDKDGNTWGFGHQYAAHRVIGAPGIAAWYDETGSYAWRWGNYVFIQLGLWAGAGCFEDPTYQDQKKLDWLHDFLYDHVGNSNMGVFIFQHYGWDHWTLTNNNPVWWIPSQQDQEINILRRTDNISQPGNPYNILGIFTGHAHLSDHVSISAGVDSKGNPISFDNYIIPDVGEDNNSQMGHAIVDLTDNQMTIHVKNRHNNTWSLISKPINTLPLLDASVPNPFRYTVGYDLDTNGIPSSWSPVWLMNANQPFNEGLPAGGGASVYDIDHNGRPDLVMMGINNDDDRNHFYYHIYWDLDVQGHAGTQVTKCWGDNEDIGSLTTGGGAAVYDFDKNGTPDILLMSVTNNITGDGRDDFRYQIGWNISRSNEGKPEIWDKLQFVPKSEFDIGSNTSGGGCAIGFIDGNDKPDLVLMALTDNEGPNNFRYAIGWNIDPNNHGWPAGDSLGRQWSELFWGPLNLGHNSQGGDVAIADLDGNGRPELIFMDVDNPVGPNSIWIEIAWNLDRSGKPAKWTLNTNTPTVGDLSNGGGCALYDLNGDGKFESVNVVLDSRWNCY